MPPSAATSLQQESASVTEPLYQVKLLSALRGGDPALIHPFLNEISKDKRRSIDGDLDTGAAALHLAIRCGSVETIQLLLSHRAISPNGVHPPGSGTTALHLAASLGRVDVVNILLEQEDINDTLLDAQGRTCKEVAKGKDVVRAIENSREFLNASYRSLLHSYILSPPNSQPSPALLNLLESPRVRHINLSYLDDDSGNSLLHEAAKRKDLRLIELAVRAGADVFVRDRRGKVAYEGTGKDDRVRVFLRQFANHDTTLIQTQAPASEPPELKGYLNKYTNVAKGYNTRWFVLRNGVLSYYRHQEDETIASRGSISMKTAVLKMPSTATDKLRFEVHSTPSRGHQSIQKWYMKANHPVEAARWTQAISKSIEWHKREGNSPGASGTDGDGERASVSRSYTGDMSSRTSTKKRSSGESERSTSNNGHSVGTASVLSYGKSTTSIPSTIPSASSRTSISGMSIKRAVTKGRHMLSGTSHTLSSDGTRAASESEETSIRTSPQPSHQSRDGDTEDGRAADGDDEPDAVSLDDESSAKSIRSIPHNGTFDLHGNATAAQIDLTAQLLSNLGTELPQLNKNNYFEALKESYSVVQGMMNEYLQMARDREEWYKHQLASERHRQRVWEESLATVVKEGEMLEKELRMRSRKRGSRFFDITGSGFTEGMGTLKARPRSSFLASPPLIEEGAQPGDTTGTVLSRGSLFKSPVQSPGIEGLPETDTTLTPVATPIAAVGRSQTQETVVPSIVADDDDMGDTDDEDEFFDAIEANAIPNLVVPDQLKSPTHSVEESVLTEDLTLPYVGYRNMRNRLPIVAERPPTSLWSVLKHSIGKDLTKISFPAEDMEFSECLDAAVHEKDPHRRIAFVAAFAMSNYSSTIGRIAKPFNPMLASTPH
ncbi:hypothetical protein VNI00_005347 [Paramarasmius palmivorus]|uniref:PH domain-containing protein n=1 Tax=Paramarasmius palmivorus TaxID=297713 RepID=A0AAW0DFR1_9AGAR